MSQKERSVLVIPFPTKTLFLPIEPLDFVLNKVFGKESNTRKVFTDANHLFLFAWKDVCVVTANVLDCVGLFVWGNQQRMSCVTIRYGHLVGEEGEGEELEWSLSGDTAL